MVRQTKKKMKNIGVPATPPESVCESHLCPWHGSLRVRGRVFSGRVKSAKATLTAVVEWDYYTTIQKYQRSMRKRTSVAAHNPVCIHAREGNRVTIAECRPISKTKQFVIIEKLPDLHAGGA